MIDKRCKYRFRECREFYLYIKYKKTHIYYCVIPQFHKCISTGCTNLKDAYIKANQIYDRVLENKKFSWDIEDKFILSMLPKNPDRLTISVIERIQKALLDTGISGKTVNNRMGKLHKYIDFPPVPHTKQIRKCYPIEKLYHMGKNNTLAFLAVTTGMRKGEFDKCRVIEENDKLYLQIDGTKTDNSVRKVPIIPEIAEALEDYRLKDWGDRDYRFAVDDIGRMIGIDPHKDNIVFHSFRKCYKTAMMGAGINEIWQEYYMGHSIEKSNVVSKLYFIPEAADDTVVYKQMTDMLKQFI